MPDSTASPSDGTSSAVDIIRMSKGLVWTLALAVFLAM